MRKNHFNFSFNNGLFCISFEECKQVYINIKEIENKEKLKSRVMICHYDRIKLSIEGGLKVMF
ncbi:hypothetical protein I871_02130 [Borrelia miyamotoi LB-2001]|nr:hypothetical protein I871_02130 [Borrelia miyamotoi LB-2001]AJA58567.1 hypothetical protein RJ61_01965 [Borrelia miyamotoi]AOW95645.1 hypothetical protein AXH25_01975 [Borrelia miyamotoi]